MSIVNRINSAILARIRGEPDRGAASRIAQSIEQIVSLVVMRHEQYVGDLLTLIALLPSGDMLRASEEDAGWPELLAIVDRSGRAAMSSTEWRLRLVADPPGTPLMLIDSSSV